ncbi:hypothetical protein Hypma_005328 [Hypsizygus marmoreus]|uniref:ARID domain-containing protein n=1 Tax=Hypsizygus marmoreus TaxID=39966 RepID=A0A369K4Z4_HYPMA|nr:hypothetical protein Hypma_005328 [Hypsizygus marmoreus]
MLQDIVPLSPQRSHPDVEGEANAGPHRNQISPNVDQQLAVPARAPASVIEGSASSPPALGTAGVHPTPPALTHLPSPLDRATFESNYKDFCASKGIKHEMRLLALDGRHIDLHMLHTEVMQEGGLAKVHAKGLWNIIGGRMGFVNFPATNMAPGKSGPVVAQRLTQVYEKYVWPFDQVYINAVNRSRRAAAQGPANTAPRMLSTQQMQLLICYASQPVADLRAQSVSENIIKFVEQNRAHLQRFAVEQGTTSSMEDLVGRLRI